MSKNISNSDILMAAGWNIINGKWCNPKLDNEWIFDADSVDVHDTKRFLDIITSTAYNTGARNTAQKAKEEMIKTASDIDVHRIMSSL